MGRALAALVVLGCQPAPSDPVEAFQAMHAHIYDAWSAPDRDAVHEVLSEALTGEALTRVYVQTWSARSKAEAQGASVQVLGVEYGDVVALPAVEGRPRIDASWWVRGIVRHQQHAHPRINHYRAVYTLEQTPEGWKIADTELVDVTRVAAGLGQDALFDDASLPPSARGFMDPLELLQGLQ